MPPVCPAFQDSSPTPGAFVCSLIHIGASNQARDLKHGPTLHPHMLVWILGALSPQAMRDRLLSDVGFENALLEWLENSHFGDYSIFTNEELKDNLEEEFIESRNGTAETRTRLKRGIRDPASKLPTRPADELSPPELDSWKKEMLRDADEVVFVSNHHDPNHGKGCLRGDPAYCRARFPRETFEETQVDEETGAIRFAKREPWINTYHPVLSHVLRCNTDVTCLLSGTQVKAIMAYVTDYVTKSKLTTESFFDTVRAVLDKNSDFLTDVGSDKAAAARTVIVKVVNALSASAETGGPAVCAYLLGQPDHYTDRKFKVFHWYQYCLAAKSAFLDESAEPEDRGRERVLFVKSGERIVQLNKVDDYIYRPEHYSTKCLYDYLRATDVRRLPKSGRARTSAVLDDHDSEADSSSDSESDEADIPSRIPSGVHKFQQEHPRFGTHGVYQNNIKPVLNFVGRQLPHRDKGDREEYCFTMLVLFAPSGWRTGRDLKQDGETWTSAFNRATFTEHHVRVMQNMNVLYECLDARDDFAANRRNEGHSFASGNSGMDVYHTEEGASTLLDNSMDVDDNTSGLTDDSAIGPRTAKVCAQMTEVQQSLGARHGIVPTVTYANGLPFRSGTRTLSPAQWKRVVLNAKENAIAKLRGLPVLNDCELQQFSQSEIQPGNHTRLNADVRVVTQADMVTASKATSAVPRPIQDSNIAHLHSIISRYTLNEEQTRAFRIVADHMHHHKREPLRMYLGGMAGSGKSRVLLALTTFLEERNESHRLLVLGPTGSSAALVGGSTYHSVLKFNGRFDDESVGTSSLETVRGTFEFVEYIFFDEISMYSCASLEFIHSKLNKAMGDQTACFGNKSVIFAGDFTQLPPPGRAPSLYSDKVGPWSPALRPYQQKWAIGKALWHQVTMVVILRKNMRQRGISNEDALFRAALENLRYAKCTHKDIALFSSCICRPRLGDKPFSDSAFMYMPVITP